MSDYSTPAHPPTQALYPPVQTAGPVQYPPVQPVVAPQLHQYPQGTYGYTQHPAPYGYHAPPQGEAYHHPPSSKRPLEETNDGPTPTKFDGAGRGRGRPKVPGHLWGWQRIGFFEDRPSLLAQPACHSHQKQGCERCYTYVPTKKN